MHKLSYSDVSFGFGKKMNSMSKVLGVFALCLLASVGLAIPGAEAAEPSVQPTQGMHDMSDMKGMDMKGMEDMPGMEHMDHAMHQKYMSHRRAYSTSTVTYQVPDVTMLDANGKSVSLDDLMDDHSAVMLNFIFTTCTTICPVMTSIFGQVQDKLGKDREQVRMVSISIDPENDTPAKLTKYKAKYKADAQWSFLTGTLDNSVLVQKAFGVWDGEKMNHKPVTLLKAKGSDRQWVRIEGLAEADQIVAEYHKLGMAQMQMKHE